MTHVRFARFLLSLALIPCLTVIAFAAQGGTISGTLKEDRAYQRREDFTAG